MTYENLVDFVGHLNTKETASGKEALKVTVKRTTKENAGEYLKVKDIASLPGDDGRRQEQGGLYLSRARRFCEIHAGRDCGRSIREDKG